nr:MAG TPA: hypothetical protein [Caudoviricetes sp.]
MKDVYLHPLTIVEPLKPSECFSYFMAHWPLVYTNKGYRSSLSLSFMSAKLMM